MAEPKGKYVKKGDVEEWQWDKGDEPGAPASTGGWAVPKGEFDPRTAPSDTRSASEKLAEEGPAVSLKPVEEPKAAKK